MNAKSDKSPKSRDKMIEATISLMRRSGLSGAGINEIVKESGAPKGSIYYFFPEGKRQIASEALTVYGRRGVAAWDEILSSATEPAKKIEALFDAISSRLEQAKYRQSCAAGAVCLDLEDDLEVLRRTISTVFSSWIEVIYKHFPIRNTERRKVFAGFVLTVIEGAFIRARAERSSKPFSEAIVWLARIAEEEIPTRRGVHSPRLPFSDRRRKLR